MVQLVMLGGCEEPVPDPRSHREVGMGDPSVAEAQSCTHGDDLGARPEERKDDRSAEAQGEELSRVGSV